MSETETTETAIAEGSDPAVMSTTYRRADGALVCGEFSTVDDLDFFLDDDPGTQIVREVWVRQSSAVGTVQGYCCVTCHGEGETDDGSPCVACDGSGEWDGDWITWEEADRA